MINRMFIFMEITKSLRYCAYSLNLVVAVIILSNPRYLERTTEELKAQGLAVDDKLFQHLSPLGWEHINLTGDYIWQQNKQSIGVVTESCRNFHQL